MRAVPSRTVLSFAAALALLLVSEPRVAAAQGADHPAGQDVGQEIVRIEHANVEDLPPVLRIFNVAAEAHPNLGILTLQGPPDKVAAAAAAARELDVPPAPTPNLDVTVFVLGASKTKALTGTIPPELAEVARQLKEVFGFRGVDLIDSVGVRVLNRGGGGIQGILSPAEGVPALPYRFGFNHAALVDRAEGEPSIRLSGFHFEAATQHLLASMPANLQDPAAPPADFQTELATDVEVRAGQTAVVGRAATAGGRDGLILVVRARVLD